jgi:hypothetical protein
MILNECIICKCGIFVFLLLKGSKFFKTTNFTNFIGRSRVYKIVNNVPMSCHVCDRLAIRIEMLNEQTYSNFQIVS